MDVLVICAFLFVLILPLAWLFGFLLGFIEFLWLRFLKPRITKEKTG